MTALHTAALFNDVDAISKCVEIAYDVNEQVQNGRTPLHYACERGNLEAVTELLKSNPDLKVKDIRGMTALDYARREDHKAIENLIVSHGEAK